MHKLQGSGLPLFMVHGNGVDHQILLPLDEVLAELGMFERHYLDLPGFGQRESLSNAGGLPELADWLEKEIRAVVGDGPFALLGNSMGGLLCQEMADRFSGSVQGLFLIAPAVYADSKQRTLPDSAVAVVDQQLLESLKERDKQLFTDVAAMQTRPAWERFSTWVLPGLEAANLRAMAKLSKRYFLRPLPLHRESRLTIPVSIVCGRHDHVTGFEDPRLLAKRYADLHIIIIEQAGHNVHIEQPEAVEQELRAWSAKVRRSVSPTGNFPPDNHHSMG
ncbi:alpha/beta hydrolase [Glutamicibacter sp. JL.03c]|uniref:alpha/beta fold hydrolase n=1 Tax=Glutamicibacter sp. JL.03c TaxID=2984842 RepID=UPI0021F79E02|nr:alpha/beta hydrolase [Glutamicibacter sp. JL.03c]UYQ76476.1 alpha/beta hydrolase [Glutamicibacter sp. JL.03c]